MSEDKNHNHCFDFCDSLLLSESIYKNVGRPDGAGGRGSGGAGL